MIKGTTKVIVGRGGKTTIQEELNGKIRNFTINEWNKELERRRDQEKIVDDELSAARESIGAPKVETVDEVGDGEGSDSDSIIEEDDDEEEETP